LDWLDKLPPGRQAVATTLVASAIATAVGALWFAAIWSVRKLHAWKAQRAIASAQARERAASLPKKLGFSEMLIAEEDAIAAITSALPRLVPIMTRGVEREQAIKKQMAALAASNPKNPQSRRQFNQIWMI
jgi:hypothetical protein